ncbi:putative Acylphosphatase family protein [Monocercomonoides exilis]|uniref:putative Acylphosphatase family protein n=1 Tax=Monocercomonoides exilis TaxID=2049356 RepID=UPI00355A55F2|nr:putative Acylphosphatase family protein [Monocercomonoides exilis]|eukprot:MONOS_13468.1-p1 / transcript=MONOS_13468.1 / gene=MONOS_13468 / organism=Monocercomonoides_exilis_PA203 / gene_product=Acylphosphatase family protein / transcript_product=Acylphosphatase family protein / location=Mono_scaffold00833:12560-13096(-) / protein_length=112 / sequence_SO=supercontig / SO=protein_coding / is_pseudo=false
MSEELFSFSVRGKVQGVMFRQTIIRACQARGIRGGATNSVADKHEVILTFSGNKEMIEEILAFFRAGKVLNSWGAQVTSITPISTSVPFSNHQVTTENVDTFKWNPRVEFYM